MNILKKEALKKELSLIGDREWELSEALKSHDIPDEELEEFSKKYPNIYCAIISWAEELYALTVRQDEINRELGHFFVCAQLASQLEVIERSIWTLKQAQEVA